jgi:putative ATPase
VFEAASAGARSTSEGAVIDRDALDDAIGAGLGHYTVGDHYDAASALIKHLRASHAEQAMAWLVHMLDGGEDPRFIARRLLIFASEDIGIADRSALLIAEAASRAVEFVGMPEARYSLGHAVLVLARAPKSREVGAALEAAVGARLEPPPGK